MTRGIGAADGTLQRHPRSFFEPFRRFGILAGVGMLFIASSIGVVSSPVYAAGVAPWVGAAGPGGGTVYYYSSSGFSCGTALVQTCHYLEVAGSDWNARNRAWSSTNHEVSGTSTVRGTGAKNTSLIVAGNSTLGYAATDANSFVSNTGHADWFLPSLDELISMVSSAYSTSFGEVGTSSQGSSTTWKVLDTGRTKNPVSDEAKQNNFKVLAVRAFSKSDSSLASLAVAGGVLSPAFDPSVLEYNLTTDQQSIQFTSVAVGASSVMVGTSAVGNGRQSDPISLNTGLNQVTLTVTAADATSTSYTVNINSSGYVVSFDGNGATGGSVPGNQTKTDGVNLTIASNLGTLTKTGYTFAGWNTAADGSGTAYGEGASYVVDSALSLFAQWTANSLTVTYNSQAGSAVSAGATVTGGLIAPPGTPTRTGFVFTGWFAASSGGSAITFPYTHGRTADFTLYAQWVQASLYGLGSITRIGTITTTAGVSNTFAADTEDSSVSLRYQANGLPANTVIDIYLVNDLTRAQSLVAPSGGYVVSLVVAWLAADGTVPLTASGKPILMTIANSTIKAGAKTYAIIGNEVTLIGTAVVDGTVTVEIVEDPEIVVVNPVVVPTTTTTTTTTVAPSSSTTTTTTSSPLSVTTTTTVALTSPTTTTTTPSPRSVTTTTSPKRDAENSRVVIPRVSGVSSPIAGVLKVPAGGSVPAPKRFTPTVQPNGQVVRVVISPVVVRQAPAGAPAAPTGAKVFAVSERIQLSQEAPQAPTSQVAAGESKAMLGGVRIETSMQKSESGVALMSAGPATIALAGFAPVDDASGEESTMGLTASASTPLEIATSSFIAATPVQVWLFSTPILLAETTVDENGNFAAAINLPSSLPSGNHTLQIQGFVFTSGGAAEVTANIAISITHAVTKQWSAIFPIFSSSISPQTQLRWKQFAANQTSTELACVLTPTSPASRSAANLQLFDKRMLNISTLLKLNGCRDITTKLPVPLTTKSSVNRTWTVAVEPQVTDSVFMWVYEFPLYSSVVRKVVTTTWTENVAAHAGKALACRVTGVEPVSKSRVNTRLFSRRNAVMNAYLAKNGCDTVEFTTPLTTGDPLASRRAWTVRVSTGPSRLVVSS